MTIGEKLSPLLVEIEDAISDHELYDGCQPYFTDEGFRAGVRIFMALLLDKMYNLQCMEGMEYADKLNMATKAGVDLKDFVKVYTDIDTKKLYV